jgi:hypothetical protein
MLEPKVHCTEREKWFGVAVGLLGRNAAMMHISVN